MKTSHKTLLSGITALILIMIAAAIYIRVASGTQGKNGAAIHDMGKRITVSRDFRNFEGVVVKGAWQIEIKRGDNWNVELSYPEGLAQYIDAGVEGKQLVLDVHTSGAETHNNKLQVSAAVTMPALASMTIAGAGKVKFHNFGGEHLLMKLSGAGSVEGHESQYEALEIHLSGAGRVDMRDVKVYDANINLAGAGDIEVTMTGGILSGSIAGVGRIRYHGRIESNEVGIYGVGSVQRVD